jgi:hypothetical protein
MNAIKHLEQCLGTTSSLETIFRRKLSIETQTGGSQTLETRNWRDVFDSIINKDSKVFVLRFEIILNKPSDINNYVELLALSRDIRNSKKKYSEMVKNFLKPDHEYYSPTIEDTINNRLNKIEKPVQQRLQKTKLEYCRIQNQLKGTPEEFYDGNVCILIFMKVQDVYEKLEEFPSSTRKAYLKIAINLAVKTYAEMGKSQDSCLKLKSRLSRFFAE